MDNHSCFSGPSAGLFLICGLFIGLIFATTTACSDDGTQTVSGADYQAVDEEDLLGEIRCYGVDVLATGAEPFERVDVNLEIFRVGEDGPQKYREIFGVDIDYHDFDEELFLPLYFDRDTDSHYFRAPHHPAGLEGGQATLRFTDGETSCEQTPSWTVNSIPPAPGTFEEIISNSTDLTRELVRSYGYDPEELIDTPTQELPAMMVPLAFHIWAMDHPDNPNSLVAGLRNNDLPFEFTDEELEIAETYFAQAGIAESLEENLTRLQDLYEESDIESNFLSGSTLSVWDDVDQTEQPLCSWMNDHFHVEIDSPSELSHYMIEAEILANQNERSEVANNLAGVVGSIPGPISAVGDVTGLVLTVDLLMRNAAANTLPRYLAEPRIDQWAEAFYEDYRDTRRWSGYHVDAGAHGWDATADLTNALIDFATTLPSMLGAPRIVLDRMIDKLRLPDTFAGELTTNILEFIADNARSEGIDNLFDGTNACFVDPGPWENIPIGNTSWLEVEYAGSIGARHGQQFSQGDFCYDDNHYLNEDASYYEPLDSPGDGQLEVNADPAVFPPTYNRQTSMARKDIHVWTTDIEFFNDDRTANPGDVVNLTAEIEGVHDRNGRWEVLTDNAHILDTPTVSDGTHVATVQTPASSDDFPVIVSLESTANTGLRAPSCEPPTRRALAIIRSDEYLNITPSYRCIEEGGELQYEARVSTPEPDPQLRWSASGGSIDDGGLFEAGEPGEFTVTARVDAYDLEDQARVRVGSCECFHDVRLTGGIEASFSEFGNTRAMYDVDDFGVFLGEQGTTDSGALRSQYHLVGGPFFGPAGATFRFDEIAGGIFEGVDVGVDKDDGSMLVTYWSDEDYIQGLFVGEAKNVGVEFQNAPGTPPTVIRVPSTTVTVEFMGPAVQPDIGAAFDDCFMRQMPDVPILSTDF